MEPNRVYLDTNILIELCDNPTNPLRDRIEKSIKEGTHSYPFSAIQIDEITSNDCPERNKMRLEFLQKMSNGRYFINSINEHGFRQTSAFHVYDIINEVQIAPALERYAAGIVDQSQVRSLRSKLGLDQNELNNLDGKSAISFIDKKLASFSAPSLREIVQLLTAQQNPGRFLDDHQKRIAECTYLFSLLDSFGFWPDNRNAYEKGTRFADSQHAFNASHFDILVTNDKRLKNRAAAVYGVLGVDTLSLSLTEFEVRL